MGLTSFGALTLPVASDHYMDFLALKLLTYFNLDCFPFKLDYFPMYTLLLLSQKIFNSTSRVLPYQLRPSNLLSRLSFNLFWRYLSNPMCSEFHVTSCLNSWPFSIEISCNYLYLYSHVIGTARYEVLTNGLLIRAHLHKLFELCSKASWVVTFGLKYFIFTEYYIFILNHTTHLEINVKRFRQKAMGLNWALILCCIHIFLMLYHHSWKSHVFVDLC